MTGVTGRLARRYLLASKNALQALGFCRVDNPVVVSIVGCPRSGTTMLLNVLERDRRSRVYHEWDSRLFDSSLRLREPEVVSRTFRQDRNHLVITKPLLDSQWTDRFLQTYQQAHAVWIYRHYSATAQSNLGFFGQANGKRNLRSILRGDDGDWRTERMSPETRDTIRSLAGPESSDEDAAALFWFARNSYYFDQQLNAEPRAFLCKYENIVENPVDSIGAIYDAIGVSRPSPGVTSGIHRNAGRGSGIRLSESVESACQELWLRLEDARISQEPHTADCTSVDGSGRANGVKLD